MRPPNPFYDEEPDPSPHLLGSSGFVRPMHTNARGFGKSAAAAAAIGAAVGQTVNDQVDAIAGALNAMGALFKQTNKQSNYTLFPPPLDEPLTKSPHSMTPPPNRTFDRQGRKRF